MPNLIRRLNLRRVRWQELIVPGIIVLFVISYWIQVRGQSRAVIIIPYGTMWLVLLLTAIVIYAHLFRKGAREEKNGPDTKAVPRLKDGLLAYKRESGLIALSVGYYFAFDPLGFTGSNLIFLLLGFRVAGLKTTKSIVYSLITTAILFGTSTLLQLDAPNIPWFLRR